MLFTQFEFIFLFLPAVLFFHERAKQTSEKVRLLVIASLIFYSAWNIRFLPMILGSVIVNYQFGKWLGQSQRKSLLVVGVILNLIPLLFFKYSVFLLQSVGIPTEALTRILPAALPLGISFYTFQQIAYLVDVYKQGEVEGNFGKYSFFAVFFPQLIAGPIVHHRQIIPQVGVQVDRPNLFFQGLIYFGIGFVKKFFIADHLATIADPLYDTAGPFDFHSSLLATLSYTLQLYFDFSGYSDMAVGLGKLFGIELPINFNSPYKAVSIVDFWRRWHITLSQFLRDYLYIPLGGNRHGNFKRYRNLFLTMLLGGLWHGAGWTFVLWGACHGLLLAAEHLFQERVPRLRLGRLGYLKTFLLVALLWVPFRAENLATTFSIYAGFCNLGLFAWDHNLTVVLLAGLLVLGPNSHQIASRYKAIPETIRLYPYKLRFRAFAYVCLTYPIVVAGMCAFYTTDLDRVVYTTLPVQKTAYGISVTEDDLRSNLLIQEVLYGDQRKVIVVGSSFTRGQGCYVFDKGDVQFKSGTLGIGGNLLVNGLRTATIAQDTPNLDAIILAVSPLNLGPIVDQGAFPQQGMAGVNALGFQLPQKRYRDMAPIALGWSDVLQLTVNYRSRRFTQLHGFYHKLATCFSQQDVEVTAFSLQDQGRFLGEMDAELRRLQNAPPLENSPNGSDTKFDWRNRGALESIRPEGDVYRALKQLKASLDARNVRLLVYETPTPSHREASHVYPPGFLEAYQVAMGQALSELEIEYYDLGGLLPWTGECMSDFIHPQAKWRRQIHKLLLYRLYGEPTGLLAGTPSYRLKVTPTRPPYRVATEPTLEGTRQ